MREVVQGQPHDSDSLWLGASLAWLGRQGTRAVAALVVVGITAPPIGRILEPFVTAAVFLLLSVAFLRTDVAAARRYIVQPGLVLRATAWTAVGIPLLLVVACLAIELPRRSPDLFLALTLHGIASPMMATPAFAALLGLDATLVLVTLVTSTALLPLTAPIFAALFLESTLTLTPFALSAKLLAILAGSALVGTGLRQLIGPAAIARHREPIDGANILILFVFVAAVMHRVGPRILAEPSSTLTLAAVAFGVFFGLLVLTVGVFRTVGRERGLALGIMTAQRNLGLMLAATAGAVPDRTWLYIALAQLPIYLSPHLLRPLARGSRARDAASGRRPEPPANRR